MKEEITLRLYQCPNTAAQRETGRYQPAADMCGWEFTTGDTIPLDEQNGGRVFAVLDKIEEAAHEDETGRYKLATAWIQD